MEFFYDAFDIVDRFYKIPRLKPNTNKLKGLVDERFGRENNPQQTKLVTLFGIFYEDNLQYAKYTIL